MGGVTCSRLFQSNIFMRYVTGNVLMLREATLLLFSIRTRINEMIESLCVDGLFQAVGDWDRLSSRLRQDG